MVPSLQQLGIDQMSADEKLELIANIWDSFESELPGEIPESHKEELDRRLAWSDANPGAGIPWEEAFARLQAKNKS